jgi:hypothetical protein
VPREQEMRVPGGRDQRARATCGGRRIADRSRGCRSLSCPAPPMPVRPLRRSVFRRSKTHRSLRAGPPERAGRQGGGTDEQARSSPTSFARHVRASLRFSWA